MPGVEASTGSLGHGLSIGVGMALAARMRKRDSRVFVIMGDGEINEGSVWEAALCAGKHGLANLVAIVDYNKIQSAGTTAEIQELEPLADKWRAFGFAPTRSTATTSRRCATVFDALAARRRQADGHDLPHRQGQGLPVRRARSGVAPQVQDLAPDWAKKLYAALEPSRCAGDCLNMVYELAKRDDRVVFIGSDLSPGLLPA